MTKAEQILSYGDRTSTEMARLVGCHDAYVRAVWQRQRNDVQEADKARARTINRTADKKAVSQAGKKAYRAAREQGASTREANRIATRARSMVARRTGDLERAAAAWRAARLVHG